MVEEVLMQNDRIQRDRFRDTERLLYGFRALEQHLKDEKEYLDMADKRTSGSVVRYQKNKTEKMPKEQLITERQKSYERSKAEYERIKKALQALSGYKGYAIIKLRYLQITENPMGFEEIAEVLAGKNGFSENLSERTVRRYKNQIVRQLAVMLFGVDAM